MLERMLSFQSILHSSFISPRVHSFYFARSLVYFLPLYPSSPTLSPSLYLLQSHYTVRRLFLSRLSYWLLPVHLLLLFLSIGLKQLARLGYQAYLSLIFGNYCGFANLQIFLRNMNAYRTKKNE